jgi:hypothetical protein
MIFPITVPPRACTGAIRCKAPKPKRIEKSGQTRCLKQEEHKVELALPHFIPKIDSERVLIPLKFDFCRKT